jgi:hypothetical protein
MPVKNPPNPALAGSVSLSYIRLEAQCAGYFPDGRRSSGSQMCVTNEQVEQGDLFPLRELNSRCFEVGANVGVLSAK